MKAGGGGSAQVPALTACYVPVTQGPAASAPLPRHTRVPPSLQEPSTQVTGITELTWPGQAGSGFRPPSRFSLLVSPQHQSPDSPRPFPSPGTKPRPFTWHSVPSWLRPQPAFSAVCLSVSLPWFNCQKLASTCRFPQAISPQLGYLLLLSTTPGALGDPPPPGSCLPSPGAARRGFHRTSLEFP